MAEIFPDWKGQKSEVEFEAMVAYCLSWYVLPSCLKDGLNSYVFPLVVLLEKGEKLALVPLYLGLCSSGQTSV